MTVISRITPAVKPGSAGVEALHGGEIQVLVKGAAHVRKVSAKANGGPNLGAWAKRIRGLYLYQPRPKSRLCCGPLPSMVDLIYDWIRALCPQSSESLSRSNHSRSLRPAKTSFRLRLREC